MSGDATEHRSTWVDLAVRLATPVLRAGASGELKARMPVETREGNQDRSTFSHLEAVGRLLSGLAPWLGSTSPLPADESIARDQCRADAQATLAAISDPASPDYCNWDTGNQPCVDAAFLAEAMLRAPEALFSSLEKPVRDRLLAALRATRVCHAGENNWLLFKAIIEAALHRFGEDYEPATVDHAIERHKQWYVGDGVYGDGHAFHADYYNSFVIQPMLLEVLETLAGQRASWDALHATAGRRAQRGAAILERLIGPDGTFPPIGRSLCYRAGAFHLLALMAWREQLPEAVSPGQGRAALTAVLTRTLHAPGTFDSAGWLRLGLAGSQPKLAEMYISTGSLYLCATALLPLGLPTEAPFWRDPSEPWTAKRIWAGQDHAADHALHESGG